MEMRTPGIPEGDSIGLGLMLPTPEVNSEKCQSEMEERQSREGLAIPAAAFGCGPLYPAHAIPTLDSMGILVPVSTGLTGFGAYRDRS